MGRKTIEQCKTGDDFLRYARRQGAEIRNGKGSHFIVSTERGQCTVPVHNSDLGKGIRCKILKTFLSIGLAGLFFISIWCWMGI